MSASTPLPATAASTTLPPAPGAWTPTTDAGITKRRPEAATGRVHFLNGAGRSGSRAGLDELKRRGWTAMPQVGPGTVSVPGATRAWSMLLERFGTRPLKSLLEPALHYAADGFPLTLIVCQAIRERSVLFDDPEWRR